MHLSNFLRKIKLLYLADYVHFQWQKIKNRKKNEDFLKKHPNIKLPPDYLMYESFQVNYHKYFEESREAAKELVGYLEKHIDFKKLNILDWGCGPGRIIRHLPDLLHNGCNFYGTDYNGKSISWCKENLQGIHFNHNSLEAKLPYNNDFFDVIYGLSIFTHLSEKMHYEWTAELTRVLKPGGIMFITTQAENHKFKLDPSESKEYDAGNLVVRGNVKEGHRTYSAFQPVPFMKHLFKDLEIVEHIVRKPVDGWNPQDIWIVKKSSANS